MPEDNPVWGIHVVEGAVTAALVRRGGSGGYEILETVAERAAGDAAGAVRVAVAVLTRRGVAHRGAVVALPDANGCLVTATIPPEELDLSEHEISNEMYEWTPFEPDQAELRHLCVVREGRRQERIVAALPRGDYRRFVEILEAADPSRLGVGFAGAATWRGASAMGLVPPGGFLIATLPGVTEVYASQSGRVRRHLLALGETELTRDATAVDLLARDLAQLADYYRALRRGDDKSPIEPRFALAGLATSSPAVRQRLAAVLGPRLADGPASEPAVALAPKSRAPNAPLPAFAGAIGAALEGLRPAQERLVLRHVPTDLPPYRERGPLPYVAAAAAVLVAAAFAASRFGPGTDEPGGTPRRDTARSPAAPEGAAPSDAAPERETESPAPATSPAPPVTAPLEAPPALAADTAGAGRVRVRWPAGEEGRVLRRKFLGKDGDGPDGEPVEVRRVGRAAGEVIDDVPGGTGLYSWSLDGAADARVFVEFRVDVELLGPGESGGARFALRRAWRDGTAVLAVDVAPGAQVSGVDGALAFDSGWRLDAIRTRIESERAAVRVPRFRDDGRVERGPDGVPVTGERVLERERRIFEADGVAPDGSRRTWSRKMTDG